MTQNPRLYIEKISNQKTNDKLLKHVCNTSYQRPIFSSIQRFLTYPWGEKKHPVRICKENPPLQKI